MKTEHGFYLSYGLLATLTGEARYARLYIVSNSFVLWAMTCGQSFPNWQTAWNEFYTAP
jgi:hypothetical protein